MIKDTYIQQIKNTVEQVIQDRSARVFLFGSSVCKKRFGDCDLGILGKVSARDLSALRELFAESTLPYKMDIVDFNKVPSAFKKNVFSQDMIWIKR